MEFVLTSSVERTGQVGASQPNSEGKCSGQSSPLTVPLAEHDELQRTKCNKVQTCFV